MLDISKGLQAGRHDEVRTLVEEALAGNIPAETVLDEALIPGMGVVGDRFRDGEIFLPEVLIAARAMHAALDILKPLLAASDVPRRGKVVIGTVRGDLHDIGKNLVAIMLEGAGFEIIDLGADVAPEAFIEAAEQADAPVIAMSALLTTTMTVMQQVVEQIRERGLTSTTRTIVGGAPLTADWAAGIGADAYAPDAASAVDEVARLIEAG
jgi:5-methyltetrahydrofolate--homocysteine methyltransferase